MNVTFYVRREEQAELLHVEGVCRINQDGSEGVFYANATTKIEDTSLEALWIAAVKYAGLRELLSDMKKVHETHPVLFVQNGIGHIELVHGTTLLDIAFATVEHGAQRIDDRTVKHNGVGMITIAAARGDGRLFERIGQANSKSFPITFHSDSEQILMRKVLINCMINPLTAILGIKNGDLLTDEYCLLLFNCLYDELTAAFPEIRSSLPYEAVEDVCRRTACNQSSMLADRLAGRPMEIETIVSAIIRKANGREKSLPLLTTLETMLYALDGKGVGL